MIKIICDHSNCVFNEDGECGKSQVLVNRDLKEQKECFSLEEKEE